MMDQQVPWLEFKGKQAWVVIENRVDGYVPVASRRTAQQGIEVLGWDDLSQADVFVVSDLRKDKLGDRIRWRTALAGCWLLSIAAAMGEHGICLHVHTGSPQCSKELLT
ncbi:MAG: hypothetical protein ACKPKO_22065 [Candidatus Fonsibacter sp.]